MTLRAETFRLARLAALAASIFVLSSCGGGGEGSGDAGTPEDATRADTGRRDAGRDAGRDTGAPIPDTGTDTAVGEDAGCVPVGETCDGEDEDCDGKIDEDFDVEVRTTSGDLVREAVPCDNPADTDDCMDGVYECGVDPFNPTCTDDDRSQMETCMAGDEDCDGDDTDFAGYGDLGLPCDGADLDLCAEGVWTCNTTTGLVECSDNTATNQESCNGVNDDCDSATDEDFIEATMACDNGCTSSTWQCNGGTPVCNAPGPVPLYPDADGDCFRSNAATMLGCPDVAGDPASCASTTSAVYEAADLPVDCCDLDADAYPGQTAFFRNPTNCNSNDYDYNCSGQVEDQLLDNNGTVRTGYDTNSCFECGIGVSREGWDQFYCSYCAFDCNANSCSVPCGVTCPYIYFIDGACVATSATHRRMCH